MAARPRKSVEEAELDPELGAILAPRETLDLYGHGEAEARLAEAVQSGQVPHALLITGPLGVGKATLAYRFARYLLSTDRLSGSADDLFGGPAKPETLAVDPDDAIIRQVAQGSHGNLHVLHRLPNEKTGRMQTVITVAQVRSLTRFFTKTAAEQGYRVVIVDRADDMNENASNALLKILEEPPRGSVLLLLAASEGRVPATVRSRCQILKLRPLNRIQMSYWLQDQAVELGAEDIARLTDISDGAPGRVQAILELDGLALYHQMLGLLGELPRFDRLAVHKLADKLSAAKAVPQYALWMDLFDYWLQRMIRLAAGGAGEEPEESADSAAYAQRLMAQRPLEQWLGLWENLNEERRRGERLNLDRKQLLMNRFFALSGDNEHVGGRD